MKSIKDFVDVKEAAIMLGYNDQTVRAMAKKGKLKSIRRGRKWYFFRRDVENIFNTECVEDKNISDENQFLS